MTTASLKRLSWLNESPGYPYPPPDRTIEEVCWADARRTFETPAMMKEFRKLSTYPYLCQHSVKVNINQAGFLQIVDFNPLHHWSRMFEYPWAAVEGDVRKTHRVLDAGGGHGPFQYWLAERAGCVVNLDGDAESLAHVRRVQDEYGIAPNLDIVVGDLGQPGYCDWHFDRVFCISVLEHIPYWKEVAAELFRITARGGLLIITTDVLINGASEEFVNTPEVLESFLRSWGYGGPSIMSLCGRSTAQFPGCEISALCVKVRKT